MSASCIATARGARFVLVQGRAQDPSLARLVHEASDDASEDGAPRPARAEAREEAADARSLGEPRPAPLSASSCVSDDLDARGAREPPSDLFACAPSSVGELNDDASIPSVGEHHAAVELSRLSGVDS